MALKTDDLDRQLRKKTLRVAELQKENDALTRDNRKMKEVLRAIRAQFGELGTMVRSKPL